MVLILLFACHIWLTRANRLERGAPRSLNRGGVMELLCKFYYHKLPLIVLPSFALFCFPLVKQTW